jgi:RNA polymerase sigma factor (sigma-70 family)
MSEMQRESDAQLLRQYAEEGTEMAFTEIVTRYTNLVYSVAIRQVGSPDIAAEIAHRVFINLAREAKSLASRLSDNASLAGWLCRCAHNLTLKLLRDEFRRHSRERQAMENLSPASECSPDWEKFRPILDEAMSQLTEPEHDALVMRFFNNQDLRSVGQALGVSDDTARKRVSRALEKLREHLARRGIDTSCAALSVALSANAVQTAPVGLAASISTAALVGSALPMATSVAASKAVAMTAMQKTFTVALLAVMGGTGGFEAHQNFKLREQNELLREQQAPLVGQIQQLERERDETTNKIASLARKKASNSVFTLSDNQYHELLRLRGAYGVIKDQLAKARERALFDEAHNRESETRLAHKYAQRETLWEMLKDAQKGAQEKLLETHEDEQRLREVEQYEIQAIENRLLGTNGPPNLVDPPLTDATQQAAAKQNIEILTSALEVPETVAQADPFEGLRDEKMTEYWPYFRFKAECEALLQTFEGEQTSLVSAQ